jgi:hypothetical protein
MIIVAISAVTNLNLALVAGGVLQSVSRSFSQSGTHRRKCPKKTATPTSVGERYARQRQNPCNCDLEKDRQIDT